MSYLNSLALFSCPIYVFFATYCSNVLYLSWKVDRCKFAFFISFSMCFIFSLNSGLSCFDTYCRSPSTFSFIYLSFYCFYGKFFRIASLSSTILVNCPSMSTIAFSYFTWSYELYDIWFFMFLSSLYNYRILWLSRAVSLSILSASSFNLLISFTRSCCRASFYFSYFII